MDETFEKLANEAVYWVTLRDLQARRREGEAIPAPERKASFQRWREGQEKALKSQIEGMAKSVVETSLKDLVNGGLYSEELLIKGAMDLLSKEPGKVAYTVSLLSLLPEIQKAFEEAVYHHDLATWNGRCSAIDDELRRWQKKALPLFEANLINVDKRFPIDRVQFIDGKAYDKWLSDALKSKPIPFDPHSAWVEGLIQFYTEVYKPLAEAELKEQEKPKAEVKAEPPKSPQPFQGGLPSDWREVMGKDELDLDVDFKTLRARNLRGGR